MDSFPAGKVKMEGSYLNSDDFPHCEPRVRPNIGVSISSSPLKKKTHTNHLALSDLQHFEVMTGAGAAPVPLDSGCDNMI